MLTIVWTPRTSMRNKYPQEGTHEQPSLDSSRQRLEVFDALDTRTTIIALAHGDADRGIRSANTKMQMEG